MPVLLPIKQRQFNDAMAKYAAHPIYLWIGKGTALTNLSFQVLLGVLAFRNPIVWWGQILACAAAFVLADFINGLVHMLMDNHADYTSWAGPLVAAFHLHHRTPRYMVKPWLLVYFHESGSKLWLAPVLILAAWAAGMGLISPGMVWGAFYFGVLSSLAEVSHYFCHVPQNRITRLLGKSGIFLDKQYHRRHHTQDNVQYTFLNAMTDPWVNAIARVLYNPGYKGTTDRHYATYTGVDTENRV